jgi:hypothetical protein
VSGAVRYPERGSFVSARTPTIRKTIDAHVGVAVSPCAVTTKKGAPSVHSCGNESVSATSWMGWAWESSFPYPSDTAFHEAHVEVRLTTDRVTLAAKSGC